MKLNVLDWLIDNWASRWVVSREDYNQVQSRLWVAQESADRAVKEMHEVMDEAYAPFRSIADKECELLEIYQHYDIRVRAFRWTVSIPEVRFHTARDYTGMIEDMRSYFVDKITFAFHKHIAKEVFRLDLSPNETNTSGVGVSSK